MDCAYCSTGPTVHDRDGILICSACNSINGVVDISSTSHSIVLTHIPNVSSTSSSSYRPVKRKRQKEVDDINSETSIIRQRISYYVQEILSTRNAPGIDIQKVAGLVIDLYKLTILCSETDNGNAQFRLPKNVNVRYCGLVISVVEADHVLLDVVSRSDIIKYFLQYIGAHNKDAFLDELDAFLVVIQEFRLRHGTTSTDPSNPGTGMIVRSYENSLSKFIGPKYLDVPTELAAHVMEMYRTTMFNVYLDGRGPKMAIATVVVHCLVDKCHEILTSCFKGDEDAYDAIIQKLNASLSLKERVIDHFLIGYKKRSSDSSECDPRECKRRALHRSLIIFNRTHNCKNEKDEQ